MYQVGRHKIRFYKLSVKKKYLEKDVDDSGLYFVQDENNFIYPLLQVGSGFG